MNILYIPIGPIYGIRLEEIKLEHMWQLQALGGSAFVNELHNYMSAFSTFGKRCYVVYK